MAPKEVSEEMIDFIEENIKQFPGRSSLKFLINDTSSRLKFGMYTLEKGFEMNDEMANFLQGKPELDIKIEFT
jgi:DNA polymerase-3 subunit alpha